jgi:cytochrome P450
MWSEICGGEGRAHKRRLLMLVLLALLVASAFASTASAAAGVAHAHRAAADSSLTVAVVTVGPEVAPIYLAQARGYLDRHVAFGVGLRHRLGNHLARLELQHVVRTLATRCPDLQLNGDVAGRPSRFLRGPEVLSVRLAAG